MDNQKYRSRILKIDDRISAGSVPDQAFPGSEEIVADGKRLDAASFAVRKSRVNEEGTLVDQSSWRSMKGKNAESNRC